MSPFQRPNSPHKRSYVSIPTPLRQEAPMGPQKEVPWGRLKTWQGGLGQGLGVERRIKRLCSSMISQCQRGCGATLTVQQWRIGLRQDHRQVTPPLIVSLLLVHTTLFKTVPRYICLRHFDHDQDHHNTDSLQSRSILRTAIRRFLCDSHSHRR